MVSPFLLRAWKRAHYEVDGIVAHIGAATPEIDQLLAAMGVSEAIFVGAWNPGARHASPWANSRNQARLIATVARFPSRAGHGYGPGCREPHLLLGVTWRQGLVIARRFGQAAVVGVRRGQKARLLLVSAK